MENEIDALHPDTEAELDRRWKSAVRRNDSAAMAEIINTRNRLLWYLNTYFPRKKRLETKA